MSKGTVSRAVSGPVTRAGTRRAAWWVIGPIIAVAVAGCSGGTPTGPASAPRSGSAAGSSGATTGPAGQGADAAFEQALRGRLRVPGLPDFAIPTDLLTSAQDRDVARRLRLDPGLYRGIAVVSARCDGRGGQSTADTDSGSASRPAGTYKRGNVNITVKSDGTGVYNGPGLHVTVLGGGKGVYEGSGQRLTVERDGGGTFADGERRLTVRGDGSGSYTDDVARLWVGPDGAGGYDDGTVRASVGATGRVSGSGTPGQLAAVGRVVTDGLPRFAPAPAIRRVAARGRACGTVIRLDANVLFDFGSARLRPDARSLVERVGRLLAVVRPRSVRVNGYTDGVGSPPANLDLSGQRARAVQAVLAEIAGRPGAITARGWGETHPVRRERSPSGADLPAARQLNRRVEIVLPAS
jgi:OmpA-OmpF porin, OOP family